jgi:hypothetical protein
MRQGVYNGSYTRLGNVPMRQAYASALNINLDVRGDLPSAGSAAGRGT